MNTDNYMPEKIAYSINEGCNVSSLSRTKIYSLIAQGRLHVVRVGGRTLIPADSLRGLISGETV